MKAIVQEKYGSPDDVLTLRDIEMPVVGDDEVLVRVRAASMHPDVWHAVTGLPYVLQLMGSGLRKPKRSIPGSDLAGYVEAIGKNVTRFCVGDEVFGLSATLIIGNGGAFAEYAAVPEELLALKPNNVTFEQAAAAPLAGYIALCTFGAPRNRKGQHILINGAGGCVGSIAIQIAKTDGAYVTGVDCAEKLTMMRLLGADNVVDYARESFLKRSERYDFIFDVASNLSLQDCKRVLAPAGIYWPVGHGHYCKSGDRIVGNSIFDFMGLMVRAPFDRHLPKLDFKSLPSKPQAIVILKALLESGTLKPIIAKTFPLSEVPAAIRCLQEGCTPGRIIITP